MAPENEITPQEDEQENPEPRSSRWRKAWLDNKGALLIVLAQLCASSTDAIARFLQQGVHGVHPFQVIFARMGMTLILSNIYMWYSSVPSYPFGQPPVRGLLAIRALFGFAGLFCLYYSVHYLPLAEATILRFLVPIITSWACSIFLGQIYNRKELLAGLIALIGVVFIAHPSFIFGQTADDDIDVLQKGKIDDVTPTQRLIAIAIALLGVFFASGAYTMIRVIGSRAHALISVNYFAFLGTFGSAILLIIVPGISFTMPHDAREWILLVMIGVLGFALQFLLTTGLQLDKSSKATSMLYTAVVFALAFDGVIWGVLPGLWSWVGGFIVIGATLWSALQKPEGKKRVSGESEPGGIEPLAVHEESALLGGGREREEERGEDRGRSGSRD